MFKALIPSDSCNSARAFYPVVEYGEVLRSPSAFSLIAHLLQRKKKKEKKNRKKAPFWILNTINKTLHPVNFLFLWASNIYSL